MAEFCCEPPCRECELATELAEERTLTQQLCSAVKQHRQATESRLRHLDSRGEAARVMLKPDRDLYEVLDRLKPLANRSTKPNPSLDPAGEEGTGG